MEESETGTLPEISEVYFPTIKKVVEEEEDAFSKIDYREVSGLDDEAKDRISKRFEGRGDAASKKSEDQIIAGYDAFDVVSPPYNLDYLTRLYTASEPHYAASNAKVSNIVGLGYDFIESPRTKLKLERMEGKREKLDKARAKLRESKIDMLEWVDSLNDEDTFSETLIKVWRDYEATGNGYIEVGRQNDGTIGYIGHIPAKTMRVRRKRDGFIQLVSNHAVFFRRFGKNDSDPLGKDRSPNEVIHLKKHSPDSNYYGVPDIIAATNAVSGLEFSDRFNLDYFENKAVPRHVIILKGATLNPSLAANLLGFFESAKGQNHRSMFIPLPGDSENNKVEFKIEPVEAGIQDASFTKYREMALHSILRAHRVPITKVDTVGGMNIAAARDADRNFKEQVCRPEQHMLEKKLNKIFKQYTDMFVFKLNEMTLTDEETQSKIDERNVKNGLRTRNELRARDGYNGIDGGDGIVQMEQRSEARAEYNTNRERDARRSANATDSSGESRNEAGAGRTPGTE